MNKKNLIIADVILAVIIAAAAGFAVWHFQAAKNSPASGACPAIAKLCSDGSSVSPSGPNCQFAACPMASEIQITNPFANTFVSSPVSVQGQALGNWFFEAVFPVKLYDANNRLIAQGQAKAQSSWTVAGFVPFSTTITFSVSTKQKGTLVLENDNPSGDPAKLKQLKVPVILEPAQK